MELEFVFVAVAALLQVIMGAPPVEVSQSKMTVLEKQTMTAVCRVGRPISYCRFYLPQIGGFNLSPSIPPERGIEYYGAGLDRGECGIRIANVQKEHNGLITCHLAYSTESQESTGQIELVVAQPPLTPKLKIRPGRRGPFFEEGEKVQADCRVEGGRPVANISWFLGTDPITEGLSSPNYENGPGDLKTVSQSLTLPVKYTDHGKDLRCVANHIALGPSNINHSIHRLEINFPPKPKSSETEQFGFTIGQPGKVIVMFNANPKPNIHWEVGTERLTEGMKDSTRSFHALVLQHKGSGTWAAVLDIAKVTASDVEKKYTLVAENELGREAYKVAISTSPAPPADITAGAIAGIVVAVLVILLIIFILIFARAFGKWCFAGSKPRRQARESKYEIPKIGSLTYKNYKPVEIEDGKKVYVSPEDEKKLLLASKIDNDIEAAVENESKRTRPDSCTSDSFYETPIQPESVSAARKVPERDVEQYLKLPPHIEQISEDDANGGGRTSRSIKFPRLFRKSKTDRGPEEKKEENIEAVADPLNEQIPVKVSIEQENHDSADSRDFSITPEDLAVMDKKNGRESGSDESEKSKDKGKITFRTIFGIEKENERRMRKESLKKIGKRWEREREGKAEETRRMMEDEGTASKEEPEEKEEGERESLKFPTNIPPRGLWGPRPRRQQTKSAPEMRSYSGRDILHKPWKTNKKERPVSLIGESSAFYPRSDTESADHGSADKSSVSKLTEEKQQKRFIEQLLDTIKRKNKDKVADNEALRNLPVTIDKDLEQQMQKEQFQKDHLKSDGIVYAELDMTRSPGNVVRRDDEKTEYAEIIHPKTNDFQRTRDEVRRSSDNLSGSREHLTEDDATMLTPDGKKEAAV